MSRRAVLLVGWPGLPAHSRLREFAVLPVGRRAAAAPPPWWQRLAARLEVEAPASWLVARQGLPVLSREVTAAFLGCVPEVGDERVRKVLAGLDAAAGRSRVVTDFDTAARRCERLRRTRGPLVFTNGVFDLFHLGHLRLLQAARALGGALVVGINSDESVRGLKGHRRPVVPQFARAQIVAGLRGVDLCVIFPEATPHELLQAVHPDVLVKGSEYAPSDVVGAELVVAWGGRVERVPHLDGWSTTTIRRRLRGR